MVNKKAFFHYFRRNNNVSFEIRDECKLKITDAASRNSAQNRVIVLIGQLPDIMMPQVK
jgi:hypothetical protein